MSTNDIRTEAETRSGRAEIGNMLRDFLRLESASGILLLGAALLAMIIANSPLANQYAALMDTPVAVQVGELKIAKPLLLWINDGLMAVFFFLVGMEIKREMLEGELSSASQVVLPAAGAFGGMAVPALVYCWLNWEDPVAIDGWAIPVATDIAFALGLLRAFGSRVPTSLKVFLLTLAIFDDLAAIVIIALFYSGDLSLTALVVAGCALCAAVFLNRRGTSRISPYVIAGVFLWVALLKSGVHATLAGVLLAFCIPIRTSGDHSPLRVLEHDLHGPVAYFILPIFAFANAGLSLSGIRMDDILHPVPLGVIAGLVVGKPVGVLLMTALVVVCGFAKLPRDTNWLQVTGIGFACGIGFTMSLFIAGLAFEHGSTAYFVGDRLGILVGSVLAAIAAFAVLSVSLPKSD